MTDWMSDPATSAEDKLKHFESLGPRPTRGPLTKVDMPFSTPPARTDLTFSGALFVSATPVSGNFTPRLAFASDVMADSNKAGNSPAHT